MEEEIVKEWKFKKRRLIFETGLFLIYMIILSYLIEYFSDIELQSDRAVVQLQSLFYFSLFYVFRVLLIFRPFAIKINEEAISIAKIFGKKVYLWKDIDHIYIETSDIHSMPIMEIIFKDGQEDHIMDLKSVIFSKQSLRISLERYVKIKSSGAYLDKLKSQLPHA